jgi:hypothetical protein
LSGSYDFGPPAIGFSPTSRVARHQCVEIEIEQVLADCELTSVVLPDRVDMIYLLVLP